MFRRLASFNGSGLMDYDSNGGALREVNPVVVVTTTYTLTSEDVMRGVIVTAAGTCVYTLPTVASLLADYPDWAIGASISFLIVRGATGTIVSVLPADLVADSTNGATAMAMSRIVVIRRSSDTAFRFHCLGL